MPLVVLLLLTLVGLQRVTGPVPSDTSQWPRYRDEANRLSFAYPTELHPVTIPAEKLRGFRDAVSKVLLLRGAAGDREGFPVLQATAFVCDPVVRCLEDESFFRKVCDRFERFPLGDATAIQCVTYGSAACHWSAVVIRGHSRVEISAPEAERELQAEANTRAACADAMVTIRKQPIIGQVLASFRFDGLPNRRVDSGGD